MRRQINGTLFYPMSQRIADTRAKHGFLWTYSYYVLQNHMPAWEFMILSGQRAFLTH